MDSSTQQIFYPGIALTRCRYNYAYGIGLALGALLVGANLPAYLWHEQTEGLYFDLNLLLSGACFIAMGLTESPGNVNWYWFSGTRSIRHCGATLMRLCSGGAFHGLIALYLMWAYRSRTGWAALTALVLSTALALFLMLTQALSFESGGVMSIDQGLWCRFAATVTLVIWLPLHLLFTWKNVPMELLAANPLRGSARQKGM